MELDASIILAANDQPSTDILGKPAAHEIEYIFDPSLLVPGADVFDKASGKVPILQNTFISNLIDPFNWIMLIYCMNLPIAFILMRIMVILTAMVGFMTMRNHTGLFPEVSSLDESRLIAMIGVASLFVILGMVIVWALKLDRKNKKTPAPDPTNNIYFGIKFTNDEELNIARILWREGKASAYNFYTRAKVLHFIDKYDLQDQTRSFFSSLIRKQFNETDEILDLFLLRVSLTIHQRMCIFFRNTALLMLSFGYLWLSIPPLKENVESLFQTNLDLSSFISILILGFIFIIGSVGYFFFWWINQRAYRKWVHMVENPLLYDDIPDQFQPKAGKLGVVNLIGSLLGIFAPGVYLIILYSFFKVGL